MVKSTKDILEAAKALIENKGWAQGYFAFDSQGNRIGPWKESEAVSYCTIGALIAICSKQRFHIARGKEYEGLSAREKQILLDEFDNAREEAKIKLTKVSGASHIPTWNDEPTRTKQDVLDAYERAIALCQ